MKLRDYQHALKDGAFESWRNGHRNVALVSPTGSGKTVTMAAIASDLGKNSGVIIAHRVELVGQISTTLAAFGIFHQIIGPSSTVKFCIQKHIRDVGKSFVSKRSSVTVAAVDTLVARAGKLEQWSSDQRWWMIDECFVAGTLIDNKPIEKIRVGDEVTAFDECTGGLVRRRVTRTFRNSMPDEILCVDIGHHSLYVTKGHPFWTRRGWVTASELSNDDYVYADALHALRQVGSSHEGTSAVSLAKNRENLLLKSVRVCSPGTDEKTTKRRTDRNVMLSVRSAGEQKPKSDAYISKDGARLLRQDVQRQDSVGDFIAHNGSDEQDSRFRTNDQAEPDEKRRGSGEGIEDAASHRSQTEKSGRERETVNPSGSEADGNARSAGFRGTIRGENKIRSTRTAPLQNRLCTPDNENRNRSGRSEPYVTGSHSVGHEEGRFLTWRRVDRVQVLKRDDPRIPGDGHVYNIEVEGVHTYLADGVVVHNCHHVLQNNKWGKAIATFRNAYGVGVTATPLRADRKSLHADQGGVFTDMIVGPSMRELINRGSLCDYRIFAPTNSIDTEDLKIGSTGDYSQPGLRAAAHKSQIVGDIVQSYLKIAKGKRGITFTVDVEQAIETAQAFNDAGVPAMAIHAKTDDSIRDAAVRKLADGTVLQLVNVDLFGEGFDVPVVEVVSMGRPTMSYGLYVQQFGRALRPFPGKTHGIIIDHVGNVKKHRLPDAPRRWSLYAEERGARREKDPDEISVSTCVACFGVFEAVSRKCPYCGHTPEPVGRDRPEQVDGDLTELDPRVLAAMRGEIDRIDGDPVIPYGATPAIEGAVRKRWGERQDAQRDLRETIALWAGHWHARGAPDSEIHRRFWHLFGTDVFTAQTLGATDARALTERITNVITHHNA